MCVGPKLILSSTDLLRNGVSRAPTTDCHSHSRASVWYGSAETTLPGMSKQDYVLRGPPLEGVPDCSLGEYIVEKLRSHPQDKTIQVEADTGAVQTVGELLSASIRLSEGLRKMGVKENDVVGLMCRNCFEACEIVLGTWLTGAVIAPLPGSMTVVEFKHSLNITKPKIVFCDEESISNTTAAMNQISMLAKVILVGNVKNSDPSYKRFEDVLADVDVDNYKPRPVKSPSTQLSAILPSSGTSGLPKGVGITHTNLVFQDWNLETVNFFKFEGGLLQISHFFWLTGVLTFLKCLTSGSPRILLRNPDVPNCLKAIEQYKPEITVAAPLFALSIAIHPDFEKYDVSSLKTFLVGGSPFIPSIGEKIKEKWPEVKLTQAYGATEVSGMVFANTEGDPYALGKVTAGVQVKVVDRTTGESLKPNTLGEILVKSPGLMACYVGNQKAFEEAVDADGWFHTGDIGYYNDSAQFYLVDRMKEMVKVMNMQVSPSELENEIMGIPGVIEVGVSGVTHDGNLFELLALVVKDKNSTVTAEDIHARIANNLSEYKKLTGGVYFVDSLPKTASGKINKSKVKTMAQDFYSKQ